MVKREGPGKKIGGDKAHATYSASGSSRWLACPGSIALSEKAPPPRESPYAKEGTEAHACLEFLLKNGFSPDKAEKIARKNYPSEMVEHALVAATWILNRFAEASPGAEFLCETRVDASPFTCADQFGTIDAAIVDHFGKLTVIDYKYGAGIAVSPEGYEERGNSQLVYYALGISHEYHHNFSEVELVVIQPRAYHESGETVRTFTMSMQQLLEWRVIFRDGVIATTEFPNKYNNGEWCRFCPAAVICPKLKEEAFDDADICYSDTNGIHALPVTELIDPKKLGTMLDACTKLEVWIEKLRDHAFGVLQKGGKVPGYKLVDKKAQRKWKDDGYLLLEATTIFGDEAFAPPKLLSPAQMEKLVPSFHRFEVDAFLKRFTIKESSGVTMVKDTDRRVETSGRKTSFKSLMIDVTPKKGKQ